ncbi:hypothetical protein V2J56_01665 [Georgenia sp. MJ206]|uniref:hypothetical protein n=1 Tax=Georgenia wangjunii TaxID=3117730 RepID=UPI002F261EBB
MSRPSRDRRQRFHGHIAGVGTEEGTRFVVGVWDRSPLGAFADVMVERPDGRRILLAPDERVARFVAGTYRFDEVHQVPVRVSRPAGAARGTPGGDWSVRAGPLEATFGVGGGTALGRLLRLQPPGVSLTRGWALAVSPLARLVLPGVRTVGTAGGGRREWYSARHEHRIVTVRAAWDGNDLGGLRPVSPPPAFGFSSTPARPSLVRVVSTVELVADHAP